jgi:homoserine dehydrogenase
MNRVAYLDLLLVGFGHVGRRFARLMQEHSVRLRSEEGLSWRVVGIATRSHGSTFDTHGIDLERSLQLVEAGRSLNALSEHEVDRSLQPNATGLELIRHATGESPRRRLQQLVVCETTLLDIKDGQPATSHVTAALRGDAHVITANKGPAAFAYRELAAQASSARKAFLFEGAVMDGIPVFNLVRETLPSSEILGFRGVINATTNYILSAMEDGRSFDDALREMQAAGIAESDASFDVDGWDAAAKCAVLINALMKGTLTPHTVEREGIAGVTLERVQAVMSRGKRLRLVAHGEIEHGHPVGRVELVELDAADPLAALKGVQNLLLLKTDVLGEIGLLQRDGGLEQTAYALLSDLVTIARQVRKEET